MKLKKAMRAEEQDLHFLNAEKFVGFRSTGLSAYDNVDPYTIIRELVQNSLDAALHKPKIKVVFEIEELSTSSIPGRVQYINHLRSAKETQAAKNNLNQAEPIALAMENTIAKDTLKVLWILDNGTGLNGDEMEKLLADGHSEKADESTAGSYGNGHLTSFSASDLRYVVYGGVHSEAESTVAGHTILATHKLKGKAYGEDGYLVKAVHDDIFNRFSFYSGDKYAVLEKKLNFIRKKFSTGSVVGILGFNNFNRFKTDSDVLDTIEDVVASHFVPLLYTKKMQIEIHVKGSETRVVDDSTLNDVLTRRKSRVRRNRNSIGPSGKQTWETFETLREGNQRTIKTNEGKIKFLYRVLSPQDSGGTNLHLFRNGMWITNDIPYNRPPDFSSIRPFNGLIFLDPEDTDSRKACNLIGKFEGPRHIDIDRGRLGDKSSDKRRLDSFLKEVHYEICDLVPDLPTQDHDPDFFSIEVAGSGIQTNPRNRKSGSGTPERVKKRSAVNVHRKKTSKINPPRPRSNQMRREGRRIEAKVTAVPRTKGIQIRARLLESTQNAELRIVVPSGSDETCDSPEPEGFLEMLQGAHINSLPIVHYVQDNQGVNRAVMLGSVSERDGELDIWIPCSSDISGDIRVEMIHRRPITG